MDSYAYVRMYFLNDIMWIISILPTWGLTAYPSPIWPTSSWNHIIVHWLLWNRHLCMSTNAIHQITNSQIYKQNRPHIFNLLSGLPCIWTCRLLTCSVCKFINVISPVFHFIDCVFYYTMATYALNIQYNVQLVYNVCMYKTLLHTLCC